MTRVVVFALGTLALAWISKAWLTRPKSHGFYRVFAWEFMLGLLVMNFRGLPEWFADPFCPRQLAAWALLFGSIVPVSWGAYMLRTRGKAGPVPDGRELFEFEKTTQLVSVGIFRYIRHPLYCSLLLLTWGVFAKAPSWLGAGLGLGATAFLVATAKVEETENRRHFGPAYEAYMQRTRMFIPFLF